MQDLRYALRTLLRNAAFTPAALISIALAIGAGTAVYSIADTVFLRPLPYPRPERLMWVAAHFPKMNFEFLGSPDFLAWRRDNRAFENLAATQAMGGQTMLLNGNNSAEVRDIRVSANFLRTLDIHPALGRDFTQQEEIPNGSKAVLLTDHVWRQRFRSDPAIIGHSIRLDGQTYAVAGVLPSSFQFPLDEKIDILTTLPLPPTLSYRDRSVAIWAVYGRLKPGVTMAQARADLDRLFAASKAAMPLMFRSGTRLVLEPLQQHRVGNAHKLVSILIGAVTCLLLIACANVSNLMLARWSARSGELAIRAAMGAGRLRLARQLLTEASLLAALACGLGMFLAFVVLRSFVHYAGNEMPRMTEVTLDLRVFAIGLLVSLAITLLFGGLPALQAGGTNVQTVLQESGRGGGRGGGGVIRGLLAAGEIALCLVLLSGAALLLQTLWHLRNDRLGFSPEHILTISIPVKGTKLEGDDRAALVTEILDYARHIPGLEAASQSECTPLSTGPVSRTFARSDRPLPEAFHPGDNIHVCGTDADYANATQLHILRGRYFALEDFSHPDTRAVINESAASTYFPGEDPLGKQIIGGHGETDPWKTVIGVVSDSKNLGLDVQPSPQAFLNGPVYSEATDVQLIIRHIGEPRALEEAVSAKLRSIDSGLTADFHPISQVINEMSAGARFNAILVGSFAVIAFLMAIIGVYGVLAFAVTQRTREIGIRIALGGEPRRIFGLVLREGLVPVFVGIAGGLAAVFELTRFVKSVLYGVAATDTLTLAATTLALALAAVIAISIPARRASSVDPVIALRYE